MGMSALDKEWAYGPWIKGSCRVIATNVAYRGSCPISPESAVSAGYRECAEQADLLGMTLSGNKSSCSITSQDNNSDILGRRLGSEPEMEVYDGEICQDAFLVWSLVEVSATATITTTTVTTTSTTTDTTTSTTTDTTTSTPTVSATFAMKGLATSPNASGSDSLSNVSDVSNRKLSALDTTGMGPVVCAYLFGDATPSITEDWIEAQGFNYTQERDRSQNNGSVTCWSYGKNMCVVALAPPDAMFMREQKDMQQVQHLRAAFILVTITAIAGFCVHCRGVLADQFGPYLSNFASGDDYDSLPTNEEAAEEISEVSGSLPKT